MLPIRESLEGCANVIPSRIFIIIFGYLALRETLLITYNEKAATQWSIIITIGVFAAYILFKILRHRKKEAQLDDPASDSSVNID